MQGHKQFVDKVVLRFRLSERVPKQNLYRRLAELLDWDFLYAQTQALYSHTGQPSLDPVVFFKLMLVSRLENLVSDRRLVEHCSLRLDILYFLGYEVDEDLPWHSTISRTRQLYPAAIFEHLFEHVFVQCVAAGLVTGHTQAVDSAFVKANASLESLCEKQAADAVSPMLHVAGEPVPDAPVPAPTTVISSPAHQLQRLASTHARYLRNDSGPLGRGRPQARLLSNKTHYSPADPDARISVKPGKARALNYLCSMAVDEAHGVISHVQADFADQRDCTLLPSIVAPLHQRLTTQGLSLREVAADTNYSNGVNYALLEAQGITPWIPVFGKYKPQIEGFSYDPEADCFTCPAGKLLPFKSFDSDPDGRLSKRYSASSRDCRLCPRKPTCAPKTTKRKITRTAYDAQYRRALARQQSRPGRHMRRLRQRTIEPVFGSLLQHYGLRRVNTRGRSSAHKTMLLTAIAFNLKKLLKHQPMRTRCLAIALPVPSLKGHFLHCWRRCYRRHNRFSNGK
ncbi:IS1182 family transposase (plasmid) [Hymenobacter sp. BRD128]|uniref:IS1182 family transposase n=1 Tax=Hymenobacter sp. BRD128 TaxID=2675878 RepID=UPI001563AD2D|nr:IS1182 family transposase [Hymenobacter sp. BRD128]QKG59177.1 IS1182 family transposase [Hymenobacter sp. BRD128]